jgi:hypothetical protein
VRKYTFVTVAFEADAGLMGLQARSIGLYADPSLVEEIIVIENYSGPKPDGWRELLLRHYGPLGPKVRFLDKDEVAPMRSLRGWMSQQVLKLAVSHLVQSDRYVVLDAKTHLFKALTRGFLECPSGRALINGYSYASHPLRPYLERACGFWGVEPAGAIEKFARTSTPFTMLTEPARALVRRLEHEGGVGVVMAREDMTEFFAYSAMLASVGTLHELYEWTQPFSPDLWNWGAPDPDIVAAVLDRARKDEAAPFISIHRGALPRLTPEGRAMISDFWEERGLFESGAAETFINAAKDS